MRKSTGLEEGRLSSITYGVLEEAVHSSAAKPSRLAACPPLFFTGYL